MSRAAGRAHPAVAWLALIGVIVPAWEIYVMVAGAKFTVGRLGVTLLFLPAIVALLQRGRHLVISDLFALLTAAWFLVAAAMSGGMDSLSSAGAESMEFFCSYVVARAFFHGPAGLDSFIRVLRILAIVVIVLAMTDTISGRWMAHDIAATMFSTEPLSPVYRGDVIRATSTLDHPILLGIFCALVAAVLLFWETNALRRSFLVGFCLIGCVASQSSAALMCYLLVLATYGYDRLMRRVPSRWLVLGAVAAAAMAVVLLVAEHPLGWLISHLTLDPETGYYRILIWDAALERISDSPFVGYNLSLFDQQILDATVDCVWLVLSLRFGVPTIVLLFLTIVAACLPAQSSRRPASAYVTRMRLAFTVVLVMFMFSGLTVHFWNYMWIFWGLCIGIRASLRETSPDAARPVLP